MIVTNFFSKLRQRSEVRLVAFGTSAVVAVYFGFLGLDAATASHVVKSYGYHFLLVTFVLWGVMLWRVWLQVRTMEILGRREWLVVLSVIGLLSMVAVSAETLRSKILYDEFVLQSTAYDMHYFREAVGMVRGYNLFGVFVPLGTYLDKRPNFYPFLISLVHDLTGYRANNGYWLNIVLFPVTLALAYYLGRRLKGPQSGLLLVLLLGALPLFAQNATGSGMELLNVTMILSVAALSAAYLRRPCEIRLSALVLAAALLAQTRYESAIYVIPVAIVIMLSWWRQGVVILSWPMIVTPLLLLPSALQNKILSNSPWMWELKENQEHRFSFDYLAGNLHGAGEFFFNTTSRLANSLPLTIFGFFGVALILWRLLRVRVWPPPAANSDQIALCLFGLAAIANTILIMFYYWSSFEDPMASRLSLPFHLVLAFAVVILGVRLDRLFPATAIMLGGFSVFAFSTAVSHQAQHLYSHVGIDEIEWEKRYVARRPYGERLVISSESPLPWLMNKIPSILITRARLMADHLKYQLDHQTFREILVMQSLRPTTANGDYELVPEERLPATYILEQLTEKRFGTKIIRVSRLVGVNQSAAKMISSVALP